MKMALAALIEAIFVVMGEPDTAIQQCPLAQDKWVEIVAGPIQNMLGLNLDTNRLTVAIPSSYVGDVRDIINATVVSESRRTSSLRSKSKSVPFVLAEANYCPCHSASRGLASHIMLIPARKLFLPSSSDRSLSLPSFIKV